MAYKFTNPVGTDLTLAVQLADTQGDHLTGFTINDILSAVVWRGADQPILFAPTCSWVDAFAGQVEVKVSGSQTSALEAGDYQVRVTVNGRPIPDLTLSLTDSPGNAAPLTAYCTFRDLLDYLPSLGELETPNEVEGFARQRYKARMWVDNLIQRNRRNAIGYGQAGYSGLSCFGSYSTAYGSQDDPVLQSYLDADKLIRSPLLLEMASYKSLALICSAQIGVDDKATAWQRMAARYHGQAEACACRYTAEIDVNGDNFAEIVIPCGRASVR